jgi:hydroxymethylglutaryl-CoA synthase
MPAAFDGALLALGASLPSDRVPAGRTRRCAARPDEDAVTLAAEAGAEALADAAESPVALIFASVSPPYDEGGSAQVLAELLGLPSDTWVAELTATMRDGLAAVRVALALAAAQDRPVLVCAAHRRRNEHDGDAGDGAAALLIGPGDAGLARLRSGDAHTEELRDRWRLAGDSALREGDASFVHEFGAARVAAIVAESTGAPGAVAVAGPNARAAGRVEGRLGGSGDPVAARTGILGAAHPLLRIACAIDAQGVVVGASGGLAEAVMVEPGTGAAQAAARMRERAEAGTDVEAAMPSPSGEGFDPYASAPRAWRERGQDLRLEGVRYGDKVHFPPPAAPPLGFDGDGVPTPLARTGTVLTYTRDFVYPGADSTEMAVLQLDDGARFYGQVAMGEEIVIGSPVRLVPRRLHAGGGIVQYFWKATPCQ